MTRCSRLAAVVTAILIALSPVAYASAVTNYTYDANGNMLSDGRFYYVYDGLNRMVEVREGSPGGAPVERYWYDHAGRRVIKEEYISNGTRTTYYVNEYFEMTVNPDGSTVNTSYIYANGERVAKEVSSVNGTDVYYYHGDHLGSTSVVTRKGRLFAGTIQANNNWTKVSFNESLVRPVVIAKIATENEDDNGVERVKNISASEFQIRVEEPPSYDGIHANETLGYLALEEGTVTDGGADIGAAGVTEAGDVWTRVSFANKFDVVPVVVASPMSAQDGGSGTVRIKNIDITGFDVRFEEYPSLDGGHRLERIAWVAVNPGTWTLDGKTLIVGTAASVTANYSSVTFPQNFTTTPVVLAQTQSYNEGDLASHTKQRNTTTNGFSVKIEEETDTPHAAETVGYVAVEPATLRLGSAKVEEPKYYPYGVVQEGGGEKYLYTGKERDKGTGLYYFGARYYSSSVGRFVQPDSIVVTPYDPHALNRYSYVQNNPLRYTDPTGHYLETAIDIVSLGLSIRDVKQDPRSIINWVALAADVATLLTPGAAGGGIIVKALAKGDNATDATKTVVKHGNDVIQHTDEAVDAAKEATKKADDVEAYLKDVANRVDKIDDTKGPVTGTKKHKEAADIIKKERPDLEVEQSYLKQKQKPWGTKGSARVDVRDPKTGRVYDFKFGHSSSSQRMSGSQRARIERNVPGNSDIRVVTPERNWYGSPSWDWNRGGEGG